MIRYLNSLSFAKYGKVLLDCTLTHNIPDSKNYKEEIITLKKEPTTLNYLDADWMYLDFEDEITILAVSHIKDEQEIVYFYLDKPIAISHGVYFALIPLFESSTVRCCMKSSGAWIPQVTPVRNACLSISRQMSITNIYTIFYQEQKKSFLFKGESHEMAEMTYADKGTIHCVIEGTDTILSQGDMIVAGPNQWHMLYADSDYPISFITITFDIQCPFLELLINRKFSLDSNTTMLLTKILEERMKPDMFTNDMIISELQQLLLIILRMRNPSMKKLRTSISMHNESKIINDATEYIMDHIYTKLSVSNVAKAMNVSTSHLSLLFQRHLQIPPGTYIRNAKLEESKSLIAKGENNFSEIAKQLHYTSVHHFSKQFKQQYGSTPTEYAKSIHFTGESKNGR